MGQFRSISQASIPLRATGNHNQQQIWLHLRAVVKAANLLHDKTRFVVGLVMQRAPGIDGVQQPPQVPQHRQLLQGRLRGPPAVPCHASLALPATPIIAPAVGPGNSLSGCACLPPSALPSYKGRITGGAMPPKRHACYDNPQLDCAHYWECIGFHIPRNVHSLAAGCQSMGFRKGGRYTSCMRRRRRRRAAVLAESRWYLPRLQSSSSRFPSASHACGERLNVAMLSLMAGAACPCSLASSAKLRRSHHPAHSKVASSQSMLAHVAVARVCRAICAALQVYEAHCPASS